MHPHIWEVLTYMEHLLMYGKTSHVWEVFPFAGRFLVYWKSSHKWKVFPFMGRFPHVWDVFPYVGSLPMYGESSHIQDVNHEVVSELASGVACSIDDISCSILSFCGGLVARRTCLKNVQQP